MSGAATAHAKLQILRAAHHFERLGVHKGSTPEEINEARNALLRAVHPDRIGGDGKLAAAVTEAATVLTDTKRRKLYMAGLAAGRGKCPACQGTGTKRVQKSIKNIYFTACATCGGAGMV